MKIFFMDFNQQCHITSNFLFRNLYHSQSNYCLLVMYSFHGTINNFGYLLQLLYKELQKYVQSLAVKLSNGIIA